jgi:1,4-alpha-glucan branching enzyme
MGSDVGQYEEWNSGTQVKWDILQYAPHSGLQKTLKRLNEVYRQEAALYQVDFHWSGFEWIDINDVDRSAISFLRRGENNDDFLVVVCNFTPGVAYNYRIGVPAGGGYQEIFNSDATEFWGSGVVNGHVHADDIPHHGREFSLQITLPPLGVTILKPSR